MGFNLFHVIRRGLQTREFIHLFVINISCAALLNQLLKNNREQVQGILNETNKFVDPVGLSLPPAKHY